MKNIFFVVLTLLFAVISCRGNEEDIQQIDQVVNIYIKDAAGKDLLNNKLKNTYFGVSFLDLNSDRNLVPITSFSLRKNADTVNYIDYTAGAVRLSLDSLNKEKRIYFSDFLVSLTKNFDAENTETDIDTVKIEYTWTPALFQISRLYYNKKLVFSKVQGDPNIVTIIK